MKFLTYFLKKKKLEWVKITMKYQTLSDFFFFFFFFLRMLFAVVLTGVTGTLRVHFDSAAEK